jgi:phage antirepressor YoqD-like protein
MTDGGMQELRVLSEADMLRLIVNSKLPEAEKFERLVYEEILPSIRKTGFYGVNTTLEYLTKRLEGVEVELFAARKIIDFHENSDDVFDFDYVAAAIAKYRKPPFGVKHLFQWLVSRGILTHRAYKNDRPMQKYIDLGWFEPRNHTWRQRGKCRHTQTYWFTARGLNGVIRMAIEEKMLLLPTPVQSIFPILIDHEGNRRTLNLKGGAS